MPDRKISQFAEKLVVSGGDFMVIVDQQTTPATNKKILVSTLLALNVPQHKQITFATINGALTTIVLTGTPVKVAGVTTANAVGTAGLTTLVDNRILNDSGGTLILKVSGLASFIKSAGGGTDNFTFYPAINGVFQPDQGSRSSANTSDSGLAIIDAIISLPDGDFLEVWVENNDGGGDLFVEHLSLTVTQILS